MPLVTLPSTSKPGSLTLEKSRELLEIQLCAEFPHQSTPQNLAARAHRRVELLQQTIEECADPDLADSYAAYLAIAIHAASVLEQHNAQTTPVR